MKKIYDFWFNLYSFYLGVFCGLHVWAIQENLLPITILSFFGAMICVSYVSIVLWQEVLNENIS